jgi:polysaccharide export outer membrane protein
VKRLKDARLLQNPIANVFVEEYRSRTVTVIGPVQKPSVYPLERRTTLLEVLSLAGGLLPNAGNTVTVTSARSNESEAGGDSQTVNLAQLFRGQDAVGNIEVHDGDIISVSNAQVVYVVGSVGKPGGFVLPDQSAGTTVLEALAMAEGVSPIAATDRALIIRRSGSANGRQDIPINVSRVLDAKEADIALEANDVLFIPASGTKRAVRQMGQVGLSLVNGIANSGVGYRIGTR